jgi:hypothetical protein
VITCRMDQLHAWVFRIGDIDHDPGNRSPKWIVPLSREPRLCAVVRMLASSMEDAVASAVGEAP